MHKFLLRSNNLLVGATKNSKFSYSLENYLDKGGESIRETLEFLGIPIYHITNFSGAYYYITEEDYLLLSTALLVIDSFIEDMGSIIRVRKIVEVSINEN